MRPEYLMILRQLTLSDLILIDETGVKLIITCHCARVTKGKRAYGKYVNNQGKNIILIETLATSGYWTLLLLKDGQIKLEIKEYSQTWESSNSNRS